MRDSEANVQSADRCSKLMAKSQPPTAKGQKPSLFCAIILPCLPHRERPRPSGWCPTSSSLNRSQEALPRRARRSPRNWRSSPSAVPDAPVRPPAWSTVQSKTACFGCPTKTIRRLAASRSIPSSASAVRSASAKAPTAASLMAVLGTPSSWSTLWKWKKKSGRWRSKFAVSCQPSAFGCSKSHLLP